MDFYQRVNNFFNVTAADQETLNKEEDKAPSMSYHPRSFFDICREAQAEFEAHEYMHYMLRQYREEERTTTAIARVGQRQRQPPQ